LRAWPAHLVKADIDRSDVGGADGGHREEAVLPAADVDGSLVEIKDALQPASDARIHAEQLTWKHSRTDTRACNTTRLTTNLFHVNSTKQKSHATACK